MLVGAINGGAWVASGDGGTPRASVPPWAPRPSRFVLRDAGRPAPRQRVGRAVHLAPTYVQRTLGPRRALHHDSNASNGTGPQAWWAALPAWVSGAAAGPRDGTAAGAHTNTHSPHAAAAVKVAGTAAAGNNGRGASYSSSLISRSASATVTPALPDTAPALAALNSLLAGTPSSFSDAVTAGSSGQGAERPPTVTLQFTVPEYVTCVGQRLIVVGSVPELGCWDVAHGVPLAWQHGHRWTADVELTPGWHGALEYKVVLEERGTYTWEPGNNRLLVVERPKQLPAGAKPAPAVRVECAWGKAEAPSPVLPPSLQCSPTQAGLLASGAPANSAANSAAAPSGGSVVMANCQVVVPLMDLTQHFQTQGNGRLASRAAGGSPGPPGPTADDASSGAGSRAAPDVQLVLTGSVPALGCWDPAQGLQLACDESGMWRATLELPMGYPIQAKLVLWDKTASAVRGWEKGCNRVVRLPDPPASLQRAGPDSGSAASVAAAAATLVCSTGIGAGGSNQSASGGRRQTPSRPPCPFPIMPDGEFMLIMHWGVPGFPHLAFLPSLDHLPTGAAAAGRGASVRASGAPPRPRPSTVLCKFTVPHLATSHGQHVLLVGGVPALGSWDPTRGLRMQWGPGHSWQATVSLPADADVEAKLVLWDGHSYVWEGGANRRFRPGAQVAGVTQPGHWGEVLHCLYWGSKHATGKTPALVIPHDELLASSTLTSSSKHGGKTGNGQATGGFNASGASSPLMTRPLEPSMAMLSLMALITALALRAGASAADSESLYGPDGFNAAVAAAGGKAAAAAATAQQVQALEAAVAELQSQLADATAARAREADALRIQLVEANRALAAEEDQVEELHAQLASRGAEVRSLQAQLARAEATAAAAVAAATTALSSASMTSAGPITMTGGSMDGGPGDTTPLVNLSAFGLTVGGGGSSGGGSHGVLPGMAVATFQKLMEQLAELQLQVDTARRELTEVAAAKAAEGGRLRSELSDAMAARHRDNEAARAAAAAAALAHQQEVAALRAEVAEAQAARAREQDALHARLDAAVAASASETSRLARQLAQACAAAEALEAQVLAQRSAAASLSASGNAELKRLRGLLSAQAAELEALRGQLADGHAEARSRLAASGAQGNTSSQQPPVAGSQPSSNNAGAPAAASSTDMAPATSDGLPSELESVMADVRAAKQALEELSSAIGAAGKGPSVDAGLLTPTAEPGSNGMGLMANGVTHPAASNGNGNGSARNLNNILPLGNGACESNGAAGGGSSAEGGGEQGGPSNLNGNGKLGST